MSVALSETGRYFTREEFGRWYDAQPSGRFERVDGRIVAMASERMIHVRLKSAVWLALRRAVADAGVPCEALADGVRVEAGDSDYEPDAVVNCGPRLADDSISAANPVIVVEVLSPGTQSVDTGTKLTDYFQLPSLAHYLIVHARRRAIIHHGRTPDGIDTRIVSGGAIAMDPPGITISVEEVYS